MDPSSTLSHCRNSSIEQTAIFYSWFKRMLTFCGYIPGTVISLPRDMDGGSCRAHLPSILCTPFSAVYHTPSTAHHHSLTVSEEGSFPSAEWAYGRGKGGTRPGNAFAHCSIPRQAGWARTIGTVARATASRWHFLRKASRFPPPFRWCGSGSTSYLPRVWRPRHREEQRHPRAHQAPAHHLTEEPASWRAGTSHGNKAVISGEQMFCNLPCVFFRITGFK